jgi:biotin carboxylase
LPASVSREVEQTVNGVCRGLSLRNTTFHAELLLRADGRPTFLEIGARLPGGYIPFALEAATGFDLITSSIDLCLGRTPDLGRSANGASAIEFIKDPIRLSALRRARGALESSGEVVSLLFYEGTTTGRLGHLIWKADSCQELRSVHRRLDEITSEQGAQSSRNP